MIKALAITGPTASGKTAISLSVAEALGCEIISLDSMQIYRRMDIGTAKATPEERERVPHHMLDLVEPDELFSQEDYKAGALAVAREIVSRGKIPLFVGGTGLYYDSLTRSELASPPSSEELTERLMAKASTDEGREGLWQRLAEVDLESAEKIHKNNVRRLVRALEIYELTGRTKTSFDEETKRGSREIDIGLITLDFHDREILYERINERVDAMLSSGLLSEVRALFDEGLLRAEHTAAQAIGYKELVGYLSGESSLEDAIEEIKLSSRRYAKRQLAWWRHHPERRIIYVDDESGRVREPLELIGEAVSTAREIYDNL